ncbi:VaFE repeat-containing surface-anchored protein [Corynebacterium glutamicum]|uniref:Gram-positive cocci surface proteins LPxTG domain-containing protein n=6 Tax=Corynebacterium glutamicum TaxID=1718 RepID=A0AB36I9H4_CORGT|nr:VaFE repeat-containing surface-anchored protein [Corynebacterium glutamicum]AGN17905.1 hypothetical protein C624_01580 [Corynebacterium glutamicum SCgG1]AGN20928.1 hypothetical protein C629_01580 [Corynebacterium glutamicum SCgG2]NII88631.1 LPXTG-motif cell wall-anchored protein [Corynebacterium glutamicum]OKX78023.1 hypothetical protein AUP70_08855 [Corynebacterium glutamicum]OKX82771.1 hypothetical protein AUP69_05610 [Corynebacterium glutamicum]
MVELSTRINPNERRFVVFIAAFLAMILVASGLATPAYAQQENAFVVTLPSASSHNGKPVYESGKKLRVEVGYGVMDDGYTGVITVPEQIDPSSIVADLSGNTALESVTPNGDGTITFQFTDPFPAGIQQGLFWLDVELKEFETSGEQELKWEFPDGSTQTIDIVVKSKDDEFKTVSDYENKAISSDPWLAATVENGVVSVDSAAFLGAEIEYRININTAEGGTFKIKDNLDEGLVFIDGSFSATRKTWDSNGMNKEEATVSFPQQSGSSFTESIDLPANSEFVLLYKAQIKDQSAVDAIVDKLQSEYERKREEAGDDEFATIYFSTSFVNSATINDGSEKAASFAINGSESGRVGPEVNGVFSKTSDFAFAEIEDPETNDFEEVDLTYTLKVDLTPYAGFENTSKGLGGNVVIVDTLPSDIKWRDGESDFLVADGMVLTRENSSEPLTAQQFESDEYVGKYYVDGKNLFINIGQDTTTIVSIDVKATITGVNEVWRSGGNSPMEEARYWGPDNTAVLTYPNDKIIRTAKHSFAVMKDGSSGINDPQKFSKTTTNNGPIEITQGEPALIEFKFTIGAGIGDARKSIIVDKIDHDVFDVSEETLAAIKASITGNYHWNYPIDGDTMDVTIDGDGNLVFAPNDQFPKAANWGAEASAPFTETFTFAVTIPTHPLYGKQTLQVENKASYRGSDFETVFDSGTEATATSYGNEMELRKRVYNEDSKTFVSQLRVELNEDGELINDEFIYAVELIPHGQFKNMVLDVEDFLPAEVDFVGFINANDFNSGNLDRVTTDPVTLTNTNAKATYVAGERKVHIGRDVLTSGQTSTLYFKVKLTDFEKDQPIANVIGNAEATIVPSNDYPLNIVKVDTSNEENKITDTNAIFQIKKGDDVVVDNVYVVNGNLVVSGDNGAHKPVAVKEPGEYTIVEVKAPAGFLLTDQEFNVSITEQGVQTPDQVRINNQPGQDVADPVIGTSVAVEGSDVKVLPVSGGTVIDTVTYEGLTVGQKYILEGELFTKAGVATGIKGSREFIAEAADGSVAVAFEISADQIAEYAGEKLVAFESLFELNDDVKSEDPVAEHRDVEDEAQTFTVDELPVADPVIGTSVAVEGSDVKVLPVSGGTVIDTVTYEGLTVGQKYILEGELFTKAGVATGIKGSREFIAEAADGSVAVAFEISADQIAEYAGEKLVAFESLFELNDDVKSEDPVAEHRDVEDEAQTFTVDELPVADPAIGTTAKVTGTTDKVLPLTGGQVIDSVAYKDLQPNTKYVLQGVIQHVATDGTVTSTDVVASTVFTTGDAPAGEFFVSGNAEVKFNIDQATAAEYAGERLVVFEQLWLADDNGNKTGDEPVAVHEDPTDEAQTFYAGEKPDAIPGIGTTAKVTGSADKVLPLTGGEIVDTVAYKDLQPNTEYVLNGEIQHVAEDGTVTSTGVIATATFTTGAAKSGEFYVSGTTTVTFDIDEQTAIKYAGEKLVVFETLYTAGNPETPVASHVDPEDEAQSFTVAPQPEADVVVEKTVTGPKGAQVEADENALFQITATWTDELGRNFSKTFNVVPGKPVSLEGLPTNTEIYLSETGATTDVKNVKWGDVIWTGEGVVDETGTSKGATVTFTGEGPFEIGLENKTSSNGMIIIPIPIPLFPIDGGSSTNPIQPDPTQPDPKESVDPTNPTPSEGSEAGTSPSKDKGAEQPETVKPRTPSEKVGLAQTGANVAWVAGIAILLLLAGAALIVRGRRKDA